MLLKRPLPDSGADEQHPMTVCSADEEPHPTDPSDGGSFPDDEFSDDRVRPSPSPMTPLQSLIQLQVKFHNTFYHKWKCHAMAFSGNIYSQSLKC